MIVKSNRQMKREAAEKHNMAYIESQAYAQDRIEDPDKYKRRISKSKPLLASLVAIAGMSSGFNS